METTPQPARLLSRDVDRIRIAVAGLGKMGAYHVQAIQRLAHGESEKYYKAGLDIQVGKLQLCGLCDPDLGKAPGIAPGIPAFTNWRDLLESEKPDLAVIASPTPTHFDLAMQALDSGVHVFVEKPLVTTLKEFRQLAKTAAMQGCRLMSGHVERYNPVAMKLRGMLAAEEVCAEGYRFQRSQSHDARISDDIVTDKIIHDLDLAHCFFGAIAEFELLESKRVEGQVQEAAVRLRHANGIEGTLFVSWLLPESRPCREVRIACRDGSRIVGDFAGKQLRVDGDLVSCAMPSWVKPDNNQIKDELADFISYCMVPEPNLPVFEPLLQPSEIEASIKVIEALIMDTREDSHGKI
ncbi:MAG: Gfo/Idh/MocA family oxidoreductase [Verrucomicrobiota bacterium]